MILAGDIGGTKCNLALFQTSGKLTSIFSRRYATRNFESLEGLIARFRADLAAENPSTLPPSYLAAGFGIAGAVVDGRLYANNLSWSLNLDSVAASLGLGINEIALLNDVEATASSIDVLPSSDLGVLNRGVVQAGATKALISVGTGLGEALLLWNGQKYRVAPSEGGLADFAPRTEREIQLLVHLRKRLRHVCCEEVLSGRGIRGIHEFLDPTVRHPSFEIDGEDPAREITRLARANACSVCVETMDLWTEAYGSETGNLALRVLAFGGIYLAGGIAPKIFDKLTDGVFMRGFCDKAKLSSVLAQIPIHVVLNEDAPMLGAAYEALSRVRSRQIGQPQRKAG